MCAVWICAECNDYVERPGTGWRCPHGHEMFDQRIMSLTRELSFGASFLYSFVICLVVFFLVRLLARFTGNGILADLAPFVPYFYTVLAFVALRRGLQWRRRGGAVADLSPRAFGTALGFAVAFAAPLLFQLLVKR
jgi:hypothetical protein